MALILKDRVLESSTSTGTGSFTLTGAQTGYQSFTAIGNGNTTYYTIQGKNPDGTLTSEWEVGTGTWSTGNTLSRDTVLSNSLGTTAKINFSAGTKDVFVTYPSEKALLGDTSAVSSTGTGSVVLSDSPTITGNANLGSATALIPNPTVNIGDGIPGQYQTVNIAQNGNAPYINIANNIAGSTIYVGGPWSDTTPGSSTYIQGIVQLGADPTYDRVDIICPVQANGAISANNGLTVLNGLSASGTLNLTGSATANQNIATSQTSGNLTIGGTGAASGQLNFGSSTATHTVNLSNGTLAALGVRTVNIGVAGASSARTNTTIGTTGVSGGVRSFTLINGSLRTQTFTVAGLPTGVAGARSFVTDALAPTFGAAVAGSGTVGIPVYHDGTSWKVG